MCRAFAAQVEVGTLLPCSEVMQTMADCQMCATCILAPASIERTVERDDNPAAPPLSWVGRLHQRTDINDATMGYRGSATSGIAGAVLSLAEIVI